MKIFPNLAAFFVLFPATALALTPSEADVVWKWQNCNADDNYNLIKNGETKRKPNELGHCDTGATYVVGTRPDSLGFENLAIREGLEPVRDKASHKDFYRLFDFESRISREYRMLSEAERPLEVEGLRHSGLDPSDMAMLSEAERPLVSEDSVQSLRLGALTQAEEENERKITDALRRDSLLRATGSDNPVGKILMNPFHSRTLALGRAFVVVPILAALILFLVRIARKPRPCAKKVPVVTVRAPYRDRFGNVMQPEQDDEGKRIWISPGHESAYRLQETLRAQDEMGIRSTT